MTKLLAALLVVCLAWHARAEVDLSLDGPVSRAPRHKLVSGRTLTIMGLAHIAAGAVFGFIDFAQSRKCAATPTCMNEGGSIPFITMEGLLISSGAVFATAGIPMWAIGARDAKRADLSLSASGARISF